MASLPRPASSVLAWATVLLALACCEGRPQPPEFTSVFTSSSSIRVEWMQPSMDPEARVKGFRLQYKLGESGKLVKVKLNSVYSHDIEGLSEECGDYRIRMSTASTGGLSRYSSFSQVDRVVSAPENMVAMPSGSSARVTWDSPLNAFCITGYQLKYGPNENELRSMEIPALLNQYLLSDLQPGTSYLMTLAGLAGDEMGEEAYLQWYQAALPGAPANLQADPSSTQSATVMWSPTSPGIDRYEYLYGPAGTPDTKLTSGYVGPGTTFMDLEGLEPSEEYVCKVMSVNSVGQSEAATVTWTQPAPAPIVLPSKPVPAAPGQVRVEITSAETALITWTPPEGEVDITGYIVGFGLLGSQERDLTLFSVPPEELQNELDGLKPGSFYLVNIQAYNDVGDGELQSTEWQQEAPDVPLSMPTEVRGLLTYSASPTSIVVRWLLSEDVAAERTEGFRVTYGRNSAADEFEEVVDVDTDSVELQDLNPDSFYYVKVYKFNAAGRSRAVSRSLQTLTPPPEGRCAQQQQCIQQYESTPPGGGVVCPRILKYLNCLQWLRDVCMEDASYRRHVANAQEMFLTEGCNRSTRRTETVDRDPSVPEKECLGQQQCRLKFAQPPGNVAICPRILQYLNCLQWLRDICMKIAGYRSHLGRVQDMFLTEGCHGNQRRTQTGGRDPPVPGGFAATPAENILTEIIPPPINLEATVLSPTSARLSWVDVSLGDSQFITVNRFYNVRYRSTLDHDYLEERTQETSYVADFLIPGVQYEFWVQLVLGPRRRSGLSAPVRVTSRDPARGSTTQRFTVTQVIVASPTTAKAVLNWLPPPDRPNVMEYRIEYTDSEEFRDPATSWQRVTVDGAKMETVIEGLRPDQEYHARITAVFSPVESGPTTASPNVFTTPVIPSSSKSAKQCGETELEAVTRRVNFLWDEVADGAQRPPLYGVPIPYCEDEYGVEECHGLFCFCVPGKRPPALRDPQCTTNVPPCRREYTAARTALDEARQTGSPAIAAQLPHCRADGYYQPKQCSGTMCYCVTENGALTGREVPLWEAPTLRCE